MVALVFIQMVSISFQQLLLTVGVSHYHSYREEETFISYNCEFMASVHFIWVYWHELFLPVVCRQMATKRFGNSTMVLLEVDYYLLAEDTASISLYLLLCVMYK